MKAQESRKEWLAVEAWGHLVQPWLKTPLPGKRTEADQRQQECERFLAAHTAFVDADVVRAYVKMVGTDPAKAYDELGPYFRDPLFKDAVLVKAKDGSKYYLPASTAEKAREAAARTDDQTLLAYTYVNYNDEQEVRRIQVSEAGPAPQCYVAQEWAFIRKNAQPTKVYWDGAFLRFAKTVAAADDLDPILHLVLLRQVLDSSSKGSMPLARALEKQRSYLKDLPLDLNARWMDPKSDVANKVRPAARKALRAFPPLKDVRRAADEYRHRFAEQFDKTVQSPCGWLSRTEGGAWKCNTMRVLPGRQVLNVLGTHPAGPPKIWQEVGSSDSGTITLRPPAGIQLTEGQVVFARASKAKE